MADQGEVDLFSRGVDNEPQQAVRPRRPGDHKVIDDSAIFVEQLGIALAAWSEVEKIRGAQRLKKRSNSRVVGAFDQRLTHMRNVEQPSRLAGVKMLGEDPGRVLDRHVVASERRHARAKLDMQSVKRGCLVRGFGHGPADRGKAPAATPTALLRL